jgi:hypothetical protein
VSAFIRRGDRPASSIAPPPPLPVVHAAKPPPADAAPPSLPPAEVQVLTAKAKALCGGNTELNDSDRLSRDVSLYNFSCPDFHGAYNFTSVFLIVPDGKPQSARAVKFAWPAGLGPKRGVEMFAINAGFDRNTMTLGTFNKGRGLADCGLAEEWVFDGQTFQLALVRQMPVCKGVPDNEWPVHYRADRK